MENMHQKKWLIFPLEIAERELEGKLLICNEAIERGWGCIIGMHKEVLDALHYLPKGLVFVKSIQSHELNSLQHLKKTGHKIICLDEEGLVIENLDFMVAVRSTDSTMEEVDALLTWGDIQYHAYRQAYPKHSAKVHIGSNPRLDLWGKPKYQALYQKDVKAIQDKYGEYFIIPTSFGAYNHLMGHDGALHVYRATSRHNPQHYEYLTGYKNYVKNIYEGFLDLIGPLSEQFPNTNIIIRPHPSEDPKPWYEIAKNLENVHVTFSGSVTPWLLGADAVLHCGSTTAIEAHLMERPVISYSRGYNDPDYILEAPAKISINVSAAEEVLDLLHEVKAGKDINAFHPEVSKGHEWLKGWADGVDSYESAAKIMDIAQALDVSPQSFSLEKLPCRLNIDVRILKFYVWSVLSLLNYVPAIRDQLPFKIQFGIKTQRYIKQKVNDMSAQDVQSFLEKLHKSESLNDINITELSKNVIALTPKG